MSYENNRKLSYISGIPRKWSLKWILSYVNLFLFCYQLFVFCETWSLPVRQVSRHGEYFSSSNFVNTSFKLSAGKSIYWIFTATQNLQNLFHKMRRALLSSGPGFIARHKFKKKGQNYLYLLRIGYLTWISVVLNLILCDTWKHSNWLEQSDNTGCHVCVYFLWLHKVKVKLGFNWAPCHEDVLGSGGIAPLILWPWH
jgi:hypothetical protein